MIMETRELRHLLHSLVEAWPEGYEHPKVQEARNFLETMNATQNGNGRHGTLEHDRHADEAWYSI